MLEERDIRVDIGALALIVLAIFLGLSLVSYSPADPPVEMVYPFNQLYQQDVLCYPCSEMTTNACGRLGSLASSFMYDAFGVGSYYVLVSLGVFAASLLMRRDLDSPVLRTAGWFASLLGLTTLVTMLFPWLSPGTVLGGGGLMGALGAGFLRYHFADVGGFILATSCLIGGILLCTDYVLVHLGLVIGSLTITGFAGARSVVGRREPAALASDDIEEYEYDEQEEKDEEFNVRVGGRTIRLVDEDEEDETDDEFEEEEDEYEDEESEVAAESDVEEDDELEEDDEEADEDDEFEEDDELDEQPATAAPKATILRGRGGKSGRRRLSPFRVHSPEPEDRETVMSQLDEASMREETTDYTLPSINCLSKPVDFSFEDQAKEVRRKAKVLEKTFDSFGFNVKVVEIETGPVIAQYEVELESGLRLSKITGLADDLAIALRVPSVRIVAPIPGKNTVGIEVPNEKRQLVQLREVMAAATTKTKKMNIPIFLGKDVSGNPLTVDLAKLPHLLIAGRTGTGKSVCLNAIIASMLMTRRPDEVRFLMIDPKMVELSGYKSLPHLMHPVVTDMRKAEAILAWAVEKMEERYALLAKAGVRHVTSYNELSEEELIERLEPETDEERKAIPLHMPFIVIVADEIADMMMTAKKEVEQHIIRLAQKSRAVGIHLILATQKPTVDVITGLIKSNLPARIAFQVASRTDSRVVLDEMGAEKLLGMGDMLFLYPGTSMLLRGQGTFLGDDEINKVVAEASQGEQNFVKELVHLKVKEEGEDEEGSGGGKGNIPKRDDLYEDAIEVVVREGRGSCSLLQRALGIGYGRAARMIDWMAEDGVVGAYSGSRAREVLMTMADLEVMRNGDPDAEPPSEIKSTAPSAKPKKAKVDEVAIMKGGSEDTSHELEEEASADDVPDVIKASTAVVKSEPKKSKKKKKKPVVEEEPEVVDEEEEEEEILDEADETEDTGAEEEEDEYEYVEVDEGDDEYEYVYEDADPDEEYDDEEYEYEYEYEDVEESA